MKERRSTQGTSQHSMSMLRSRQSASSSLSSFNSSCSCFARNLRNYGTMGDGHVVQPPEAAAWSMSSVLRALPVSPSPICSHASSFNTLLPTHIPPSNSNNLQDYAAEDSSPRKLSSDMAYDDDDHNNSNCSICFSDIDEWLEHANKFCKPSNSHTNHLTETVDSRISAICNTFLTAPENELHSITLPSIREEIPIFHGQTTHLSCIYGPSKPAPCNESRNLLSGTKLYDAELWSEDRSKKHEAEREARNKAKLVNRMRRKEDAIDNWELQQTRRAMDEMDKIQNKLERKQLMASVRTRKKICMVKEKAEKRKLNLRQQTMKRFQKLQTSDTKSPNHTSSLGSRLPLLC